MGKLDGNDQLLAHITVQTVLETVIPKLDTMQGDLGKIKDILREQDKNRKEESSIIFNKVTEIGNLIANDRKEIVNGNIDGICLVYCEPDIAYAGELKRWFVNNSIPFNDCFYIDEYSENEDAVRYLEKNNIMIFLVEESFLRNVHCVYGLAEAVKNEKAIEYIFPIIVERSIFSERNRTERIVYWETKENELRTSVDKLEKVQHAHKLVSENLVKYERTAQSIDEFIVWASKHSYSIDEIEEIIKKNYNIVAEKKGENIKKLFQIAAKRQYNELTQNGNKFHNINIVKEIFPQASIYELEFCGIGENKERMNLSEFIEYYENDSLMLLGDGGIGKTTSLFHVMQSYNNGSFKLSQVPLYVELNRCTSNFETWCMDDQSSVFIEKYVAEVLLDKKYIDKKDEIIEKIQYEFQKVPTEGCPQYLILLDGLNEVDAGNLNGRSARSTLENEIVNALNRYVNVRFIITSRNNSRQIKRIKKIDILGVNKECIETYLKAEEEKGDIKKGITKQVMKNKELVECLKIPLFLNMFGVCSEDTAITTRGEILRDFFQKKRDTLYSDKIEGDKNNGFILDFIIPEMAWEMVMEDTFAISFVKVQKIIEKVLTNIEESIALNEISQECFEIDEPSKSPRFICDVFLSKKSEVQRTKDILDIMVGGLAILYADKGEYKFKHHYFRDYFAALHIIDRMRIVVRLYSDKNHSEGIYLDDLKKYRLHKNIIQFISETVGLHHSNPQYLPKQGWTMRKLWNKNNIIIPKLLDVFRNRFDSDIGWALWNIVQSFNSSGMGLLGVDLSDLNLQRINFNGILCGIDVDLPELATKFDNALVDLDYFLPISHREIITDVKYSNDGRYILTMSDARIIIWDSNYDYVNKLDTDEKVKKAIFSIDSNYVICCTEKSKIIIWDLWKDREYIVEDNQGEICDFCQGDSNNRIYVAFKNGNIKILQLNIHQWFGRTLRVRKTIEQLIYNKKYEQIVIRTEKGEVLCGSELIGDFSEILFSNVKFIVQAQDVERFGIVTLDDCIKVGDLRERQLGEGLCIHKNTTKIQLSPDGRFVAIAENGNTLQILDIEKKQYKRPLQCNSEITSISFRIDNADILTTAGELYAKVWEINSNVGVCIRPLGDMADWIRNAYYSPDGNYFATSSIDSTGKIWDARQKRMQKLLYGHKDRVTSIAYDNVGKQLVTTSDDCTAKVWDAEKSGCIKTLIDNEKSVHNAVFGENDRKLVTVSWDGTGTIWDLEEREEPKHLIGHDAPVHTVLFDRTYQKLITSSNDKTAIVWEAKTAENSGIRVKHDDRLNSAAFSPDGKFLITSSFDKTAKIWTSEGQYIKSLDKHSDSVRSAMFSSDGKYIVTVSRDTTGKLWDGHTFVWIRDLIGHTFFVRSAMFDRESKKVLTASYDGTVREWNLEGETINKIYSIPGVFICGCDFRNLNPKCTITPKQKKIFFTLGALVD